MFRSIYTLRGDSDPDWTLPAALRARLEGLFGEWIDVPNAETLEQRLVELDKRVPRGEAAREVVLFGRSSGARVAATFAAGRSVGAVICLSYPFRASNRRLQLERFAHLATLSVPTLIIQGCNDDYGGLSVTEDYALSPSISIHFIEGDHTLSQHPEKVDRAVPLIQAFCEAVANGQPVPRARFDEDFYMRTHWLASRAILAGEYSSGEQHFGERGRADGLTFRVLPEDS